MRFRITLSLVFAGSLALGACSNAGDGPGGGNADAGPGECTDNATQCTGNTFQTCEGGSWQTTQQCTSLCDTLEGCVDCVPGRNYCIGNDAYACTDGGAQGGLIESCSGGLQCSGGACVDLCAESAVNRSYIGCEYWAADLDNAVEIMNPPSFFGCDFQAPGSVAITTDVCINDSSGATAGQCDDGSSCPSAHTCQSTTVCALDAQHSAYAIVVSNPQDFNVDVTITNGAGQTQTLSVAAGQTAEIFPQQLGFPDQSIDGSSIDSSGYKIVSTAPVVAYQFNPLDNVNVFSNDGSLLIPRHAFDIKYMAMSWPTLTRRPNTHDYNGYVTVVAWEDGTEVSVTPTANTRVGMGGAFMPIIAGQTQTFTLDAYDVLNLEAVADGDLTGTVVEATNGTSTFGVFAGHEAIVIQNSSTSCCADHIEEMMFPTSTWGKDYAIARSSSRNMNEADVLRILAQTDGTTVTLSSGTCPTLNAGEFCQVEIMTDIEVSASEPVLIGHYLKSVIEVDLFGSEGNGDPAMALAVPVEQFRGTYTFLVPSQYNEQFISVVADSTGTITLDGTDVTSQFQTFASGSHSAARISVTAGQHTLTCPGGCGIEVYGYSDAVSYLFAGGLDLIQIVVE